MKNLPIAYFPEDMPEDDYVEMIMKDAVLPNPFGLTEEQRRAEIRHDHRRRSKSFPADLFDIRNNVIERFDPEVETITRDELTKALDTAMTSVIHLVKGSCPGTDKYLLQNYVIHSGKDVSTGQPYVVDDVRSAKIDTSEYYKLVNT